MGCRDVDFAYEMRFVFAVHGWYLGGYSTFCTNLSAGLKSQGHDVILLILANAAANRRAPESVFDRCVTLPRGFSRIASFVRKVAQEIDSLRSDVLVVNDSPYAMASLPHIRREIVRMPVIHSVAVDEVKLALTNQMWWDRVIAVSERVAETVVAQGLGSRVSVCRLGVPVPSLRRSQPRSSQPSAIQIISIGRIVIQHKRMDRLPAIGAELVRMGVSYHWTILGDGDYLPQLKRELVRLGLQDYFSLKGSVARSAVAGYLEHSDVFVMPSDSEGMPQALLEAMAYGVVPVVSRIAGSTTGLVQDGKSGYLCEPSDPASFARRIAQLADASALVGEMGTQAFATVARDFTLESFTQRFLSIVEAARADGIQRLPPSQYPDPSLRLSYFRCLGFWRSLRRQTFGQAKWWVLTNRCGSATRSGGLPPSI